MISKQCLICDKEFQIKPYRKKTAKFCSEKCFGIAIKKRIILAGKLFKKGEHFSPKTEFKKEHPVIGGGNYKGGRIKQHGYIYIKKRNHPRADKRRGYVPEHALVAEKKLGRNLKSEETIHHINGIKTDNRPENLWIFPNMKKHLRYEANLMATCKKWIQQGYNLI